MKLFLSILMIIGSLNIMGVGFSKIDARGSGCPLGSTDIIVSPDGQSVSLLFNEMTVELPNFDGVNDNDVDIPGYVRGSRFNRNLVQKICNILIEAELPPNHKVDSIAVQVDFRGSTFMDAGARAFFHSQLVGLTGPGRRNEGRRDFVARKIWRQGSSSVEDDWVISSKRKIKINGNCSRRGDKRSRFNLRNLIRAELSPQAQVADSFVFIGLDSADMVGELKLKVNSSSCERVQPRRPQLPRFGGKDCPRGLIFHHATGRCMSKRQIALWGRRG